MKKVGTFFFTFLPMLLSIAFQFLAMGLLIGLEALFLFASNPDATSLNRLFELMLDNNFNMVLSTVFAILNVSVFGLWYYHKFEGDYLPQPKQTFHPALFAGLLLIAPAAQFLANIIVVIVSLINPVWLENYENLMESAGFENNLSFLMILYVVFLGPVGEELIFRGVTMRCARQIFPFWAANLMQALLFGIFHMNVIQGSYAFVLGIILGIVCEKLGSIYYSIFLHICFNFFGTIVAQQLEFIDAPIEYAIYYSIIAVAGIAAIILLVLGVKRMQLRTSTVPPQEEQTSAEDLSYR